MHRCCVLMRRNSRVLLSSPHLLRRFSTPTSSPHVFRDVEEKYMSLVNSNELQYDENQYQIILQFLKVQEACKLPKLAYHANSTASTSSSPSSSFFGTLWSSFTGASSHSASDTKEKVSEDKVSVLEDRRGIYLYGSVGIGKTLMMDMLYDTINMEQKRRVHFHKFMLEVHEIIHKYKATLSRRKLHEEVLSDPITYAAEVISKESHLLCFDEFQVTDIADAIIMTKLFNELWKRGTILVATSNRPPRDLYLGGLNRQYFLPFIDEVQKKCRVAHLKSHVDYRQLKSMRAENAYFTPVNSETSKQLFDLFVRETEGSEEPRIVELPVMMGRTLKVLAKGRACFVTFEEMCTSNRGAADYAALNKHMDVVYMAGIPALSVLEHDRSRRFITFVDELYDAQKKFKWTSEKEVLDLFVFVTAEDMAERKRKGLSIGGTDHSWSDPTQSHHYASHVSIPASAGSEFKSMLEYQNQKHGLSEYQTVIIDSLKKKIAKKAEEIKNKDKDVNLSEASSVVVEESAAKVFDPLEESRKKEAELLEGQLSSVKDIAFAFRRCTSRLIELSSKPKDFSN